ncbi:MAG: SusC/RagA family TonB-linked outer membrane protein, partial [Bacteroidales bacterium]
MKSNRKKGSAFLPAFSLQVLILLIITGITSGFANGITFHASGTDMQEITVSGTVTDQSNGETLPGVNVVLKDEAQGTVTDMDGEFTLAVPADATLVFSFIGYDTKEVAVEGRETINVEMEPTVDLLDETVVIAYGSTPRSNLTGSVVDLSTDELSDVFTPRLSSMLQGKATGVYARSGSGRPGSTASINIRGQGSIHTTNSPLWVVDGVPVGHSEPNLNPADVESMTVLKDASATALYGSRAANGVILVQTKSPEDGVSQLSFSSNTGLTQLYRGNFSLMNSEELYNYHESWNDSPWFDSQLLETNTDWLDIATQNGVAHEYTLSYNGGTERVSTYLSGTYYNETGAIKGYEFERYSAVANLEIQATERLDITANLSGNLNNTHNQEHSQYNAYTYLPWDHPYKEDGTPIEPGTDTEYDWLGRDNSNYLYNLQFNYGESRGNNLRTNVGAELEITDWLTFQSMNNIHLTFGGNENYTDPRSTGGRANNGSFTSGSSFSRNRMTNQMLRYSDNFGAHSLQAFVAFEFSDTHSENISATGHGITAGLNVLNATSSAANVGGFKSQSARQSVLVNLQYVYDDTYMGTASFNREGSSSFGADQRYGNFWSFSAGWNMHYEDFIKDTDWINVMKLTASYGQVGNSPSGFPHLGYYELTGQYAGIPAARPYQIANPNISWESTTTYNMALESRLFNRLTANVEIYQRNNSGLLYNVPLPALTGYTGVWENIGEIQNRGVELTLEPEIIQRPDLQWNMGFNLSMNRNEVISLYEGQAITSGNQRIAEGKDMNSYYMRIWHGVDP